MFEGHPRFEVAAGSVPGRSHALAGRASQDACVVRAGPESLVAVVADGCGSSEHSEVGAWLGAHMVCSELSSAAGEGLGERALWEGVEARVVGALRDAAARMGGDLEETVRRFFLFTLVGAVIAGGRAAVFSLGDGVIAINGEVTRLGPFAGNAPPYIGYAMCGSERADLRLVIHRVMAASEVLSIVVATDGADGWGDIESNVLPGTAEPVGPFARLWGDDRYFAHPDALRRRLARMNRTILRPDWASRRLDRHPGLLEDDTTIAVIRARSAAGARDGAAPGRAWESEPRGIGHGERRG